MNWLRYLCPSCGGMYNDVIEEGKTKLLHRGLESSADKSKLPSENCIPYHDYVLFKPCGHCCPEVFAECRACKLGYPGSLKRPSHPSRKDCYCHYCVEEGSALSLDQTRVKDLLDEKTTNREFDVFLSYNREDLDQVVEVGRKLKAEGLLPWLDVWEILPGTSWIRALGEIIKSVKSTAVFVGSSGIGPWQQTEVEAVLLEFKNRGCPVVPVLLAECDKIPELPIFLKLLHFVDFTKKETDPIKKLILGITGGKIA